MDDELDAKLLANEQSDGSGMRNHYDEDDDRTKRADARFYAWSTAEWVGMPEYVQEELRPRYQVRVNFSGHDDLAAFAELVGADITTRTKTIWYPPVEEMQVVGHLRYINEDNLEQPPQPGGEAPAEDWEDRNR